MKNNPSRNRFIVIAAALAALCGCAVGPDLKVPEVARPEHWSASQDATLQESAADLARWWEGFSDPLLNSLVERAQQTNLDVRVAEARVREVRARYGLAFSQPFPSVRINGGFQRTEISPNSFPHGDDPTSFGAFGKPLNLYSNGFDSSWELDIFGGLRRDIEAAAADVSSSEESLRDVLVSLEAEVATNYFQLRGLQSQLSIARKNIESQKEVLDITKARFEAGLVSELDISQAEAQLAATQSQIPALESEVNQAMFRLAFLLGQQPQALVTELSVSGALPPTPVVVPVGLPSELLRRRPDIRVAENNLAAQTARVGVAISDWFPKFSLTGSFGVASQETSTLYHRGSEQWAFGPSLKWPIFESGRIRANVRAQNALQDQAAAKYEKAVLGALQDVERALTSYAKEKVRNASLRDEVKANQRAYELANELYTKGLTDFVRVLEAERSLYQAEDSLAVSERTVLSNLVGIYKALGGGWTDASTSAQDA